MVSDHHLEGQDICRGITSIEKPSNNLHRFFFLIAELATHSKVQERRRLPPTSLTRTRSEEMGRYPLWR